jgi:hypothetical protein
MKNRSELHRTKQHFIKTQTQVASNNIKYAYEVFKSISSIYKCSILDILNIV